MTTSLTPGVTNPKPSDLQSMFDGLKERLRKHNDLLESLELPAGTPGTGASQIVAERDRLEKAKTALLLNFQALANKVQDRIDYVATRNTLDDFREIVPLVRLLATWSDDSALTSETAIAFRLREIAHAASETEDQVRSKLVGDREVRAREQMLLADQVKTIPFVRMIPLLNANKLWSEVTVIIDGIEDPPQELPKVQEDLGRCQADILLEMHKYQMTKLQDDVNQLEADWETAALEKDTESMLEVFNDFKQLAPLPLEIRVSENFQAAVLHYQDELIAYKITENRVRGLIQRGQDTTLTFAERSSALKEAGQFALTLTDELRQKVTKAREDMQRQVFERFEKLIEKFDDQKKMGAYNEATQTLLEMEQLAPYCEDEPGARKQIAALQSELEKAAQPSEEVRVVKRLMAFLQDAETAEDAFSALDGIETFRKQVPDDLGTVPRSLREEVVQTASRLLEALSNDPPALGRSRWTLDQRRKYLQKIEQDFEASISQPPVE